MWTALRKLTLRGGSRVQEQVEVTKVVEEGVTSAPTSAPDPEPEAHL